MTVSGMPRIAQSAVDQLYVVLVLRKYGDGNAMAAVQIAFLALGRRCSLAPVFCLIELESSIACRGVSSGMAKA